MDGETLPITGGCLCGAIRYQSTEPPNWVGYCHCRMCQKAYGALFGLFAVFPASGFHYTLGTPIYHRSSPYAQRGFCSDCGTPMDYLYEGSDNVGIMIGTLDHPEDWPPDHGHNGMESAVPWHVIGDDLPQWRTEDSELLKSARGHVEGGAETEDP